MTAADGTLEGWLFGTIHALPDGIDWRTATIDRVVDRAGALLVEVRDIRDDQATAAVFARLARTPDQPPLDQRVSPPLQAKLRKFLADHGMAVDAFKDTETWAAALTLAQLGSPSDPGNGVDRDLITRFAGRPVLELEGAEAQLGIFDSLPEGEQRDLLDAVVAEAGAPDDTRKLALEWRRGDVEAIARDDDDRLLADPELRAALLTGRNRAWAARIASLLGQRGPLLVAVGAGHMTGRDGLPALLAARGYKVRRIQ